MERVKTPEKESVKIATGVHIPPYEISNEDLIKLGVVKPSGEAPTAGGIFDTTGIRTRHWARDPAEPLPLRRVVVPEMAIDAANNALVNSGWSKVDTLFAATSIPYKESLSHKLADNLRIPVEEVAGDIYTACAGSVRALHHIKQDEARYEGKRVLVVASEYLSTLMHNIHITLFSDGAAAFGFVYGEDLKILGSSEVYNPDKADLIQVTISKENLPPQGCIVIHEVEAPKGSLPNGEEEILNIMCGDLNGSGVYKWAARQVPQLIDEARKDADVEPGEIEYILLHQANQRITNHVEGELPKMGISAKVFSNIENHGNSSSVSAPMLLHEVKQQGLIGQKSKGIWASFGAGMNGAAVVVET